MSVEPNWRLDGSGITGDGKRGEDHLLQKADDDDDDEEEEEKEEEEEEGNDDDDDGVNDDDGGGGVRPPQTKCLIRSWPARLHNTE